MNTTVPANASPETERPRHNEAWTTIGHPEIVAEAGRLQAWCRDVGQLGAPRINELGSRLCRLRELAARHFTEEEEGGGLAKAVVQGAANSRHATELLSQHAEFLHRFDSLIQGMCPAEPCIDRWAVAIDQVRKLLTDLQRHEERERDLLDLAFANEKNTSPG